MNCAVKMVQGENIAMPILTTLSSRTSTTIASLISCVN
jgi:hypothetical protein